MLSKDTYDIVVIGAGITGLGVAYQACKAGHQVLVIEKSSNAGQATSANSLRIMHGGLRYLQKLDFLRSINSCRAQTELLNEFPELIAPLLCKLKLNPRGLKSKYPAMLGALLYSMIQNACGSPLPVPRVRDGNLEWYDGHLLEPQKLVDWHVDFIEEHGGELLFATDVRSIEKQSGNFLLNNIIQTKVVVNAAGANDIKFQGFAYEKPKVAWIKALNLIVPNSKDFKHAFTIPAEEGRMYFVVPREDQVAIGTFYFAENADLNEQISEFYESLKTAYQQIWFQKSEIITHELGSLPASSPEGQEKDLVSNTIINSKGTYVDVIGTKYTTFRRTGLEVLKSNKLCPNLY